MSKPFSDRLLFWFDQHGRHDLPWQIEPTPYRVWISEIMLQQTQVMTVIPYFERFIKTFSNIKTLANAKQDEVLHLWTGLGYYARARNLHKAAKIIADQYQGCFPSSLEKIMALPGIGRSTASAILSLANEIRHPILDGNVKRVLSRYHAVGGWPGQKKVEQQLWSYAESHTPTSLVRNYTQAMMDLGATICVRRHPACQICPLTDDCSARKAKRQHDFPSPKPKKMLPNKETIFAIIENNKGEILLQQRPPAGIWGGLWCFPELSAEKSIAAEIEKQYGLSIKRQTKYPRFKHTFSHFHLMIRPVHIKLVGRSTMINEDSSYTWLKPGDTFRLGFPAPVVSMFKKLDNKKMVMK